MQNQAYAYPFSCTMQEINARDEDAKKRHGHARVDKRPQVVGILFGTA